MLTLGLSVAWGRGMGFSGFVRGKGRGGLDDWADGRSGDLDFGFRFLFSFFFPIWVWVIKAVGLVQLRMELGRASVMWVGSTGRGLGENEALWLGF